MRHFLFGVTIVLLSCSGKGMKNNYSLELTNLPAKFSIILPDDDVRIIELNDIGYLSAFYGRNEIGYHGLSIIFNDHGIINQIASYNNDTLDGELLFFYADGVLQDRIMYEKGNAVYYIQYNEDGTRRGEAFVDMDTKNFVREWFYDSLGNIDSVYMNITATISSETKLVDSVYILSIYFCIPENNENYDIANLRLHYIEEYYIADSLIQVIEHSEKYFNDGCYIQVGILDIDLDSIILYDQIANGTELYRRGKFTIGFSKEYLNEE